MFNKFYFYDEVWSHLSGYINAQNVRTWSVTNLHHFMESLLHPPKIGVLYAISREKIVAPFFCTAFFLYNNDKWDWYVDLMLDFISQLGRNERKCFFQQDGACAHTKSTTINFLKPFFGKCLIGLNLECGIECTPPPPPQRPDLSPLDFFCRHTWFEGPDWRRN